MQKLYAGLLVVALAAIAAPVNAANTTYDRNLAYFNEMIGDQDMTQTVTFADGTEMTLGAAIADAAARAGNVDLQNVALGAVSAPAHAGDVWVLEIGTGSCTANVVAPGSPTFLALDGQLWIYQGGIGTLSTTNGALTYIIGWTSKTAELGFGTAGFTGTGNQDFYCFSYSGGHFAFPFIDGTAAMN